MGHASPFETSTFFENLRIHRDFNFESGSSLGSVEVHSFTFSDTPENMKCDSPTSLLVCTFASPCLGCKPKAKIATSSLGPY
jgi:hypothetical protein